MNFDDDLKSSRNKLDSKIAKLFLTNGTRKLLVFSCSIFFLSFLFSITTFHLFRSPAKDIQKTTDDPQPLTDFLYEQDLRHKEVKNILEYTPENPIEAFRFYHDHLSFGIPFILRGFMNDWPALKFWNDDEYLISKIGKDLIEVEVRQGKGKEFAFFQKEYSRVHLSYEEFLSIYMKEDISEKYYWAEEKLPPILETDLGDIEFANFLNLEDINVWQGAAGTVSLPHMDARDNFLCQVAGYKELVLIPPTQTAKLYVKSDPDWPDNYSPVNFYEPDYDEYPDFRDVKMKFTVTINPGDIIFIPSFWWHHIRSSKGKNMAINYWFTNNYMVDLFMEYVQKTSN